MNIMHTIGRHAATFEQLLSHCIRMHHFNRIGETDANLRAKHDIIELIDRLIKEDKMPELYSAIKVCANVVNEKDETADPDTPILRPIDQVTCAEGREKFLEESCYYLTQEWKRRGGEELGMEAGNVLYERVEAFFKEATGTGV